MNGIGTGVDFISINPNLNAKTYAIASMGDSMTANGIYVGFLQSLVGGSWFVDGMGISGGLAFGMNQRFSEVLESQAKYVIILGGINDIAQDQTEQEIKDALQSMYTKASNAGIQVVAVTILPFGQSAVYTSGREAIRQNVNAWILNDAVDIDYIVDASTIFEDPTDPTDLNPIYDSGDGLHPNTSGYELLANSINSEVNFVLPTTNYNLSLTKDIVLNQDLGTFDSPTFKDIKVNTIKAYGTNEIGKPAIHALASARNNTPLMVEYILDNQTNEPVIIKDFNGTEYFIIKRSNLNEGYIQEIRPQSDATHGILIKGFSPTYHSNPIQYENSVGVMIWKIGETGLVSATGIGNNVLFSNAQILTQITGLELSRNIGSGDANFAVTSKNTNSGSTGNIHRFMFTNNNVIAGINKNGLVIGTAISQNALQVIRPVSGVGTISVTSGSGTITGTNTNFTSWFKVGQTIIANGETRTVSAISSATSMTTDAWTNTFNGAFTVPSTNIFRVDFNGNVLVEEAPTESKGVARKAELDLKADLVGGKVPSSQLPSYVDDVLEYTDLASFPVTGETGKIYVATDTNKTYRWTGTVYVEISPSEVTIINASATLDFPSTAVGAKSDLLVDVPGAEMSDTVVLGIPHAAIQNAGVFVAWVDKPDSVTVRFMHNDPVNPVDPPSGLFKIKIFKD